MGERERGFPRLAASWKVLTVKVGFEAKIVWPLSFHFSTYHTASYSYAFKIHDYQIDQKIIHEASAAFSTFVHSVSDSVMEAEPAEASS